jgi:predicted nucleic acid-binding protein
VKYLLDVNALIAFGYSQHQFHGDVAGWVRSQQIDSLLTCSITELGFVRVLAQSVAYGFTVPQARDLLLQLKKSRAFRLEFVPDRNDISYLPNWVQFPKQTTDGHLKGLAETHGAIFATLDHRIPGAFLIPS